MKWDNIRKQYYVEVPDVVDNSEITETDLKEEYGDNFKKELREASKILYQYMDSHYKGAQHEHHALAIRRMIYKSERKQLAFMDAVIEYVRGDLTTSMGQNRFVDGKPSVSENVETILRAGGLIVPGNISVTWHDLEGDWDA